MFIDKNKTAQKVFNLIYYYYEIRRNQIKWRIQRANALHRKVIKSFRKNTQKEYKNLIFLLVED